MSVRLAVVVPTLNEERDLPALVASLAGQTEPAEERWLADGGSRDRTRQCAAGFNIIDCPSLGRGNQIAHALSFATADVVLILHADMVVPPTALAAVRAAAAAHPNSPGGWLGHRFDARGLAYRFIEWGDWHRAKFRRLPYGDQAQFFRTAALAAAGGFPALPLMEDLELALRLRRLGPLLHVSAPVLVSPRKFSRDGIWPTIARNRRLRQLYLRDGPIACQALHREYYPSATAAPGK